MLESAEILLLTEYLKSLLENRIITRWEALSKYDEKSNSFKKFIKNLPLLVETVKCKGKIIYITLFNEDGYFYIIYEPDEENTWLENSEDNEEARFIIETYKADETKKILFMDADNTKFRFTNKEETLDMTLGKLGPDVLTDEFKLPAWKEIISKNGTKNITTLLMSQTIISGIGNREKCEILFYAGISPMRKVGSLTVQEIEKLYEGLRIIPRLEYNTLLYSNFDLDLKIYNKQFATKTRTLDGEITYWNKSFQF